jgi:hypothetical protein
VVQSRTQEPLIQLYPLEQLDAEQEPQLPLVQLPHEEEQLQEPHPAELLQVPHPADDVQVPHPLQLP